MELAQLSVMQTMEPAEVADRLREIATYLELEGERFRARAYARAAGSVEAARELAESLAAHLRGGGAARAVLIGGTVRRFVEVTEELALAVATTDEAAVRDRLRSHPLCVALEGAEPGVAVARLGGGVHCRL